MGRKKETDEVKVKRVYPDAECITYKSINTKENECHITDMATYNTISYNHTSESEAWSDALRQINAAKKKSYYKHKISRPNNEKKGKVNIMLYPSDKKAIIGEYGSVQKFINTIVEQLKTK